MRKPKLANEEEICRLYRSGLSLREIGIMFDRHNWTIGKILERNGVERRSYSDSISMMHAKNLTGLSAMRADTSLAEQYKSGVTVQALAKKYGCGAGSVRKRLGELGVDMRTPSENLKLFRPARVDRQRVAEMYNSGMKIADIARAAECSHSQLYRCLQDAGVRATRIRHDPELWSNPEILRLRKDGHTAREIAEMVGSSTPTIYNILKHQDPENYDSYRIKKSGRAINPDLWNDPKILRLRKDGHSLQSIADLMGCSLGTIVKILKHQDPENYKSYDLRRTGNRDA
jgi:DNA invertase Pin-like site-specific DNA recombinase